MIRAQPITEAEVITTEAPKPAKGIQSMSLGRSDLFRMDPRDLRIEPGFNARLVDFDPEDDVDLALARSIAEVGVKQPLTVYMKDESPTVTDGHRRLAATLYAMDVLGAAIKSIPVRTEPKQASVADRAYTVLLSGDNRHLAPIERANQYAKLIGFGETEADIAAKIGRSRQHVVDMLALRAGPQAVVEMVKAGTIAATEATKVLKSTRGDDEAAVDAVKDMVATAKAEGRSRATARHRTKPDKAPVVEVLSVPKNHPTYKAGWDDGREDGKAEGRIAGLRRAAEIARQGGHDDAAALIELEIANGI